MEAAGTVRQSLHSAVTVPVAQTPWLTSESQRSLSIHPVTRVSESPVEQCLHRLSQPGGGNFQFDPEGLVGWPGKLRSWLAASCPNRTKHVSGLKPCRRPQSGAAHRSCGLPGVVVYPRG